MVITWRADLWNYHVLALWLLWHVSSRLPNDILPAHQPQNCWAQKNVVESVSAAFAQLYRIKLLRLKKETRLTDEFDRQLKHASETLLLLTDCDFMEQDLFNDTLYDLWHYFSVYREPQTKFLVWAKEFHKSENYASDQNFLLRYTSGKS